jgi:hypothetical protein
MYARSRSPIHWLLPAVLMLMLAALPAFAADAPKKDAAAATAADKAKAEHDAMMAEMQRYANPGAMHTFLDPLVGKWKTSTKMWMGPEPTVSEGTCERTWILGGRFLQSKYVGTFDKMPFEGMEILGYDMKKKEYTNVWIDNMGTSLSIGTGGQSDAAGKVITINASFDDPMSGKPTPYRMATKVLSNDSHTFTMTATVDGKDVNQMEITYTRVK